jgi:hypothetical protein
VVGAFGRKLLYYLRLCFQVTEFSLGGVLNSTTSVFRLHGVEGRFFGLWDTEVT